MENFKEFKGKSLDEAIEEACKYFNAAREKLEIEIVQDAKTGIFGIVGARRAKVRARRVELREAVESILGKPEGGISPLEMILGDEDEDDAMPSASASGSRTAIARSRAKQGSRTVSKRFSEPREQKSEPREQKPESRDHKPVTGGRRGRKQEEKTDTVDISEHAERGIKKAVLAKSIDRQIAVHGDGADLVKPRERQSTGQGESAAEEQNPAYGLVDSLEALEDDIDVAAEGLPLTPLEQLDVEHLRQLVHDTTCQLIRPIVDGDPPVEVHVGKGRVHVRIACAGDNGLLIGRDGQTLTSLQYMISRIVSRGMNAAVRVQLDAGEYRHRQEEKLRELALSLAEKVRQTGRSLSTRPLSSYHRRIVHICLQDADDIQTRSNGDGPLKRVVIMRKKEG
ncbi:MAG: Jag N-terminal domain-containing protein [Desulfovibrio sp.]|nr:Jag N-terminal domain-containing protein [Desulfovibrio sp.]